MRFIVQASLMLLALLIFTGCDESSENSTKKSNKQPEAEKIKIALVMKTLTNPFFIEMEKGAREAEKELGIDLIVKTAAQETSTTQQISIVDKLVRDGEVKAIVVAPADSIRLIPSLKNAQANGIHVINIDNRLNRELSLKAGLIDVPFISIDNELSAYHSAKFVADKITEPTDVAILEGIREASNANLRLKGALRAFSENENINIVASETAHWKIDEAYEVTKKIFSDNPNVTALFCANDMMALGAIEFLKEHNMTSVLVAGFDNIPEAHTVISDGWLDVTIDQQPSKQGYLGVKMARDAISGIELPTETMLDALLVQK